MFPIVPHKKKKQKNYNTQFPVLGNEINCPIVDVPSGYLCSSCISIILRLFLLDLWHLQDIFFQEVLKMIRSAFLGTEYSLKLPFSHSEAQFKL